RTVQQVNETLRHPIRILGVLPTFVDTRHRMGRQSVDALKAYFQDRLMPPVRVSASFKEAPSVGQTIFEYAKNGRGAADYAAVVDWVERRGVQSDVRTTTQSNRRHCSVVP
ncbi:MAG: hypothetical protein AAFN74_17880, partial [Myxococcota bacterium]